MKRLALFQTLLIKMNQFLCAIIVLPALAWGAEDPPLKDFQQRVGDYVKLRKKALDSVPHLAKESKPAEIEKYEKGLVEAIRVARPAAKQGEIFTPAIEPIFAAILHQNLVGAATAKRDNRVAAKQGNPVHDSDPGDKLPTLKVNTVYPKSAPLSTVPVTLLMKLPPLPPDLEYRFIGRTMVLRDRLSNLIVDFMKGVSPVL